MNKRGNDIYFITGNSYKYNEIQKLFGTERLNFRLIQKDLNPIEIQADNLYEVALFKLNSIKETLEGSYFIEDAGFFIDKPLNGFPGVWSKYVFKTIGNIGILKLIDNFEETEAHFESIIAFYFQPQDKVLTFQGIVKGKVSKEIRGKGGFGFDPIFIPNEYPNKTFAELSTEEKNKISHRGKAWIKFIKFLKDT
ncbi:MAG: XTP/dITP diphosphatase [Candidatus Lokiarchaeota archaeon]|nr:XTP/dITP diphosphatase [Candidatus Lokiarchaeota archaeon]